MARDVEFNVTAADKTGSALAAAEAKFKASQDRIRKETKKTGDESGKSLKDGIGKAAPGILDSIKGIFTKGGAAGGDLLAVGMVAASPVIGAALSAAIIGGVGSAGVIGGVLLAARDPRVKAAGSQLGQNLMTGLEQDSAGFIEPVLRNIGKIEARFAASRDKIKRIFDTSAGFLDPLVDGALNGLSGLLNGIEKTVAKAAPVMSALGKTAEIVGESTGKALETISGGSDEAASALTVLAKAIGGTIEAAGYLIRGLTEVYGVISFIPGKISDASNALGRFVGVGDEASKTVTDAGNATTQAALAIARTGAAAAAASGPVGTLTDKINGVGAASRGLYDAQTQVGAAVDAVKAKMKEHNKTLDASSEKGRANRQVFSDLAARLVAKYQAEVTANGETARSNALAGQNREAFIKLARQFGLTKTQAANLATTMGLIPAKPKSDFTLNTHDAVGRANAARDAINNIRDRTVSINVRVPQSQINKVNNQLERLGGHGLLAGSGTWAAFAGDGGATARTGGPTPVSVTSNVAVSLDGQPFYQTSIRAAQEVAGRDAWRQKVGRRP